MVAGSHHVIVDLASKRVSRNGELTCLCYRLQWRPANSPSHNVFLADIFAAPPELSLYLSSSSLPVLSPRSHPASIKNLPPLPIPLYSRQHPAPAILHPHSVYFLPTTPRFNPRTMLHMKAQRSPGTSTHAGSRWQPYNPTLIASTSTSTVPYLNTPFLPFHLLPPIQHTRQFAIPTSLSTSSNANPVRPRASSVSTHTLRLDLLARIPDGIALLCVGHAVGSLSKTWQENYLSVYTTTEVATQPPQPSWSVWRAWNPAIQRRVQQLLSPVSPSIVETPSLSPLTPILSDPADARLPGETVIVGATVASTKGTTR